MCASHVTARKTWWPSLPMHCKAVSYNVLAYMIANLIGLRASLAVHMLIADPLATLLSDPTAVAVKLQGDCARTENPEVKGRL